MHSAVMFRFSEGNKLRQEPS